MRSVRDRSQTSESNGLRSARARTHGAPGRPGAGTPGRSHPSTAHRQQPALLDELGHQVARAGHVETVVVAEVLRAVATPSERAAIASSSRLASSSEGAGRARIAAGITRSVRS